MELIFPFLFFNSESSSNSCDVACSMKKPKQATLNLSRVVDRFRGEIRHSFQKGRATGAAAARGPTAPSTEYGHPSAPQHITRPSEFQCCTPRCTSNQTDKVTRLRSDVAFAVCPVADAQVRLQDCASPRKTSQEIYRLL